MKRGLKASTYCRIAKLNVLLTSINAIPFEPSWAKGYAQLLEVLEREQVPRKANFTPAAVSSWWRSQFSAGRGLKHEADNYLSNLLPMLAGPKRLWLHTLSSRVKPINPEYRLPYAGFMDNIELVTFAPAEDIRPALGDSAKLVTSNSFDVMDVVRGKSRLDSKQGRYFVSRLLKECWTRWIGASALGIYTLSNGPNCHFFKKTDQSNVDVRFTTLQGKQTYRRVVGYTTEPDGNRRYWHFGIQARPVFAPSLAYLISSHVVFTSDGVTPWTSHRKMHSARRRQCKSWFNPEWRDRLLATLHWLSQGNTSLRIPAGKEIFIEVAVTPEQFESQVSYADPPTRKERLLIVQPEQPQDVVEEEEGQIESDDEEEF